MVNITNLLVERMDAESSRNGPSHGHMFRGSRSFSGLDNQHGDMSLDSGAIVEKSSIVSCTNLNRHDTSDMFLNHDSDGKSLADEVELPKSNDTDINKDCQEDTGHYDDDDDRQLTAEEFSMKRVEHWISQIGIHGELVVEEPGENSISVSKEDAYNYISSYLTAASSSAQLAKLGMVAIPMLTPFIGLRVLNLSGNSIARITPGSLPKALHLLNLSNNFISAIEGLRDLTRLRVLNVSYNRIARLGHGLASCSSLKELYLAGNKISQVEGLHRLLKLNILDLRFNKISTVKGLGQLAANYSSLLAINLEGNPAQTNVGDEHLSKFLLGLLPKLVYYNNSSIRMGFKEASPPFDRPIRGDHKLPRGVSHGSGLHQLASSTHGRQNPATAPSTSKLDGGKRLFGLNAMKRSQSTDALPSCPKC